MFRASFLQVFGFCKHINEKTRIWLFHFQKWSVHLGNIFYEDVKKGSQKKAILSFRDRCSLAFEKAKIYSMNDIKKIGVFFCRQLKYFHKMKIYFLSLNKCFIYKEHNSCLFHRQLKYLI